MNLLFLLFAGVTLIATHCYICDGYTSETSSFSEAGSKRLLLILLDGFRHDYLHLPGLKGFPRFRRRGVQAEYMEAIYPAESYPGYYSIATGLYGESHGMVLNYMYDEPTNKFFLMEPDPSAADPFWWEESEPIWVTATRHGVSTGMFLWPGGGVNIHGHVAKIVKPYEWKPGVEAFRNDLDAALRCLRNHTLQFAMVYCEHSDIIGHGSGPRSVQLHSAVIELDGVINEMMNKIESMDLLKSLHVIIVSDHGMAPNNRQVVKIIYLQSVLDPNDVLLVLGRGPHCGIYPALGRETKVLNDLKQLEGVNVYRKDEIPEHLHFKKNSRVPPIFIIVQKGYFLQGIDAPFKQVPGYSSPDDWKGLHGYDPADKDMRAIFLASGPELKQDFIAPHIVMTDPYNLMSHFLGIPPQPNNGSWDRVSVMLREEEDYTPLINHVSKRKVRIELVWGIVIVSYSFREKVL